MPRVGGQGGKEGGKNRWNTGDLGAEKISIGDCKGRYMTLHIRPTELYNTKNER